MAPARSFETLNAPLPHDIEGQAARVLTAACDRGMRIASAESCTGGLLAAALTDVPGCSHAFERGFVVYTDEAKREVLGVPIAMLREFTAVSAPVAVTMAESALTNSNADVSVSVTGYGDDLDGTVEAGLVHFGLARPNTATRHLVRHFGDIGRGAVRVACLRTALDLLEQAVLQTMNSDQVRNP